LLGNLFDFDSDANALPYSGLLEMDRYALHLLHKLVVDTGHAYESYEFHQAIQAIHQFCAVDMSSFYLDVLKDRLYAEAPDSTARRSAQTVIFEIASTLTRLVSPILSFTAEEAWQHLVFRDKPISVELAAFPSPEPAFLNDELSQHWGLLLRLRDRVNKAIEIARQAKQIGKPLEAMVEIEACPATYELLKPHTTELPAFFLVSRVEIAACAEQDAVTISPAPGTKCARCWLVKTDVDSGSQLCERCASVLGDNHPTLRVKPV
jgi:isoleucyl-tRNA synthetase